MGTPVRLVIPAQDRSQRLVSRPTKYRPRKSKKSRKRASLRQPPGSHLAIYFSYVTGFTICLAVMARLIALILS